MNPLGKMLRPHPGKATLVQVGNQKSPVSESQFSNERFRHKKREAGAGCSHSPMVGYRGLHSDRGWTEGPMESEKRKGAIRKKLRERKSSLFSAALGSSLLKEEGEFGKHRRVIISFRAL